MVSALIVAAGQGTRMGVGVEKLFLEVAGKPVIAHTLGRFEAVDCVSEVVMAIREELREKFEGLIRGEGFKKPIRFVAGGPTRQHSVWNGLQGLSDETEIVAIHDGARPCVSPDLITRTIEAARVYGAAVAAMRVTDTIKESEDGEFISRNLERSRLWSVQTPQCFRVNIIRKAIQMAFEKGYDFTDDTAACELIGQKVRLVESVTANPKVTVPSDLSYIELLLKSQK